jgi:Na+-transporting NADH:ubiquinone oxidoreductase subunit NqrB
MNKLKIWWADTRGKVIVTLLVLWAGSLINHFETVHVWQPAYAVFAVCLFDFLLSFIRKRKGIVTMSSFVTGLLIGLVFDEGAGVLLLTSACAVAVVSKQVLSLGDHRHIFNPAVFGIFVTSFVFNRPVAWWGAAWGYIPAAIIVVGMGYGLYRIRRLWMAMIFVVMYGVAFPSTIDGTVFLFAFIMLPETITSVGGGWWKYGWGVLVGALMLVITLLLKINIDPFLSALLIADLVGGAKRFLLRSA